METTFCGRWDICHMGRNMMMPVRISLDADLIFRPNKKPNNNAKHEQSDL